MNNKILKIRLQKMERKLNQAHNDAVTALSLLDKINNDEALTHDEAEKLVCCLSDWKDFIDDMDEIEYKKLDIAAKEIARQFNCENLL